MAEGQAGLDLLYGGDVAAGLVGCAPREGGVALWWRRDGRTEREDIAFAPYFLTSHPALLDAFKPAAVLTELGGDGYYRYRATCEDWAHHDAAIAHANRLYREQKRAYTDEPVLAVREGSVQYLLSSGRTHYKGLAPGDLNVLYFALRAYNSGGADYADAQAEGDRVVMVGLADGRNWLRIFDISGRDEQALLSEVSEELKRRDPDVIVGHNLFKGALAYFTLRSKRARVKLDWGRDTTPLKVRTSRAPAAEKQLEYPRADAAGRSFVDTWFLATYYDIVKRDLERFDAPYVARYLDRTCRLPEPVPAWDVDRLYEGSRAVLEADLRYELEAAQVIFHTLAGSYFAQAQMLPFALQDCVVRGNATKINHLLLREYIRQGQSVPPPVESRTFVGGHTEIRRTGVIRDVLNVDIASLYPSIMLTHNVQPSTDTLGAFQPLLRELTAQRLVAKREAREAAEQSVRVMADARQGAFKIFINSFFGYLGTARMNWADPAQAERITLTGQRLVKQLAEIVEGEGGSVIEIDTDGVYFAAPPGSVSPEGRDELERRINARLNQVAGGEGITAEIGEYFPAMLSHKVKNYALLCEDGSVTLKGSGMKSRGLEPYLHNFIEQAIVDILRGDEMRIDERYSLLRDRIATRTIDIHELAKTDTIVESLEAYKTKVAAGSGSGGRNRAAAYEIALSARRPLRPGDMVAYYITGEKATVKAFEAAKPLRSYDPANPDYNVAYYLKKLDENLKKVQGYLAAGTDEGPELFEEQ